MCMLLVMTSALVGQDKDPKEVLDKMSETYKAMPGFEISFVQQVMSEGDVVGKISGDASVAKEKFLVRFQDQFIYCNGPVLWTYLVEDQELTISNFEPDEQAINPANIYDIYKEGFTFEYKRADEVDGEAVDVVELISTDEDADFTTIIMYIGQKDSYLKGWDLIDYDGIPTSFQVANFVPNKAFAAGYFEFDRSKNPVDVETDLRN